MMKPKLRSLSILAVTLLMCTLFPVTAFAGGGDYADYEIPPETTEETKPELGEPLDEETDIVTRDLLYDKETNKQFITIQDRDGNIFYLVIDYDAPVNEDEEQYQTYFLNPVDAGDLAALAEKEDEKPIVCTCAEHCEPGKIKMDCPVCAANMTECTGKTVKPVEKPTEPEPEPEPEEKAGANPAMLLLVLAIFGGGGAFAYFKLVKNKPSTSGSTNLDDYDYGDDEDDEDESEWESEDDSTDEETEVDED